MAASRMSVVKIGKSIANMFSNEKKSSQQATQVAAELEATQEAKRELLKLSKTARIGFPYKPTCMAYDMVQHVLAVGNSSGYVKLYGGESIEYTIFHASAASSSSSATANNSSSQIQQQMSGIAAQSSQGSGSLAAGAINSSNSTLGSNMSASQLASSQQMVPTSNAVLFMSFLINQGALITYCEDGVLSLWTLRQKQPCLSFSKKLVNERASCMLLPFQSSWVYLGTEKGNLYILNVYNNFAQSGYDVKWNNVIEL